MPGVVVEILLGFQVPEMPLLELDGKIAGVVPWQYGPKELKIGVVVGLTTIVVLVEFAH